MKEQKLREELAKAMPEVPESFHQAIGHTLSQITLEERASCRARFRPGRVLAIAMAAVLLLGTAALAARYWNVFDAFDYLTGPQPQNADKTMQSDIYKTTVNGVEIAINEAGYDGRILFLRYSYLLPDAERAFGVYDDQGRLNDDIHPQASQMLAKYNVGWWTDNFWINGQNMDMFGGSSGGTSGSDVPGEIITTEYWRLDVGNVALNGKVEISLPIGAKPDTGKYFPLFEHPEWMDENGGFKKPDEGLVTFTLDVGDILDEVITIHPNQPVQTDEVTIKATETAFSPLMTYITLELQGDPKALEAYKAEHGEGMTDENGKLLFPYSGMDVYSWVSEMKLVDAKGTELFPEHYGCRGFGDDWAEFIYPHIEEIPDELYLAPFVEWQADMSRAVRVK